MTILLIRGPEPEMPCPNPHPLPNSVRARLVERASIAGKALAIRVCSSQEEILFCLDAVDDRSTEFVLFDPGHGTAISDGLRRRLDDLPVPFIEVHDDDAGEPENPICRDSRRCRSVVQGYGAQGYALGLAIALEHLCCEDIGRDYHVGT